MKSVLPAVNVKLFAKSVHCLAKLGNEIYIEAMESGLALKTVNSSRSAFACFLFLRPLFNLYQHELEDIKDDDTEAEDFKCKVAVKTVLQVFKSLSTIERSVESCDMNLDNETCRLIFQLKCRHGITKTHQLTFQECETLQAVFAKDLSPNILKCEHKLLNDIVINFHPSLEEVTLSVTPCRVVLRSYVDIEDGPASMMKTEMSLNPDEFLDFQVGVDTDITFSLKDLRAILAFCDVTNAPVHMHFEAGGKPLIISLEQDGDFRTNFVLATISDEELNSQGKGATMTNGTKNVSKKSSNSISNYSSTKTPARTTITHQNRPKPVPTANRKRKSTDEIPANNLLEKSNDKPKENQTNTCQDPDQPSPEIPVQNFTRAERDDIIEEQEIEPLYQKVKQVFFEATQMDDDHTLIVLAPDSDEDS